MYFRLFSALTLATLTAFVCAAHVSAQTSDERANTAPTEAPEPAPAESVEPAPAPLPPPSQNERAFAMDEQGPRSSPAYPMRPRLSRGMLITGVSILGGSYAFAALAGAIALDEADHCVDCEDVAPLLFIPLLGPFLAIGPAEGGAGVFGFLGAVQLVGAGLTIGGAIRLRRSKELARQQGFMVWEGKDGQSLALDTRTSRSFAGMNVRLSL